MFKNILKLNKMYYHSQLRKMSEAPQSYISPNGEIICEELKSFTIEIKKEYTDNDLYGYFVETFGDVTMGDTHSIKQVRKQLIYMADRYGLDELLYTIDFVKNKTIEENELPPYMPFDMQRYIPEGRDALADKIAMEREAGIHIGVN
jgi:hypothetical protein